MHDCKGECKHENVEYCSKCFKVHCDDCGKEWGRVEIQTVPCQPYFQISNPIPMTFPDVYYPPQNDWEWGSFTADPTGVFHVTAEHLSETISFDEGHG